MRITPLDIRKQEFRKAVRGFDGDDVRAFLATVADEYEAVLIDNKQLRERIMDLDDKVQEYRTMEQTLRDTLMTAERVLAEAKENAAKEADLILRDAQMKADGHADDLKRQTSQLRNEVLDLRREKDAYLARCRALAESQIKYIEDHRNDFEDIDRRLMAHAQDTGQDNSRLSSDLSSVVPPIESPVVSRPAASIDAEVSKEVPTPTPEPAAPAAAPRERDMWRDYEPVVPPRTVPEAQSPAEAAPAEPPRQAETPAAGTEAEEEAAALSSAVEFATEATEAPAVDPMPTMATPAETPNEVPNGSVQVDVYGMDEELAAEIEMDLKTGLPDESADAGEAQAEAEMVGAADGKGSEKSRERTWDMDSFTKGLGEM